MDNHAINNFIFHNNITTTGTGDELTMSNENMSSVTIEFVTNGTFTANIEAQGISGIWYPISAITLDGYVITNTISDATHLYQVSSIGAIKIRVNVTTITGNLTVNGMCRG